MLPQLTRSYTTRWDSTFFSVPGRLVSRSGMPTLRAPLEWPWADSFLRRARPLAKPATGPRVSKLPAGGAPQKRASGADIDGHHLNASFVMPPIACDVLKEPPRRHLSAEVTIPWLRPKIFGGSRLSELAPDPIEGTPLPLRCPGVTFWTRPRRSSNLRLAWRTTWSGSATWVAPSTMESKTAR